MKVYTTSVQPGKKRITTLSPQGNNEYRASNFTDTGASLKWFSAGAVSKPSAHIIHTTDIVRYESQPANDLRISHLKMMQNCPDIICTIDKKGNFTDINEACSRIWGYDPDEIKGRNFTDFIVPEDASKTAQLGFEIIKGKKKYSFENRYIHKNGNIVPMLWSVDWSDTDRLIYCVGRDASDIKSVETSLQEKEQRYRSLFDHNPNSVFALDLNGNFTSANAKTLEITSCTLLELLSMSFMPLVAPDYLEIAYHNFEKAKTGETINYEIEMINMKGERMYVNIVNMPIIINGRLSGIYAIVQDISERKYAQLELKKLNESLEVKINERTCQLEQSIKEMEAFSYSVSHDLRAPLRIINGYSKLLCHEFGDKLVGTGEEFLNTIVDNTLHMERLIDALLNLSRLGRAAINSQETDMTTLANMIVYEMRMNYERISANIIIKELLPINCDKGLIKQVFVNLISNAIKYSAKKDNPEIEIGSYDDGQNNVYYVKDNGAGFDMKFVGKLFGVFARLHNMAEYDGTGVGLALVHRVVTKHGGTVWAEAKVNEGATFFFSLPNQ